jgi:uncharacterized RDD family membrane protein YckC
VEQDVLVLTPEKAIVRFHVAGLGSRFIAHVADLLLVCLMLMGSILLCGIFYPLDRYLASGAEMFALFAIPLCYFILFEGLWNGSTPGKKIAGIRVRMSNGVPLTFGAALGRNLLRPADLIPGVYLVGIATMFTNPKGQRIGDLVANTVVFQDRLPEPRFAIAPHTAGIHPLEANVGDLRGMTIPEYNALRRFADRFPELAPAIQQKLVSEIWEPIAQRRRIPSYPNIHPIYLAEAAVMKYGREHGLL